MARRRRILPPLMPDDLPGTTRSSCPADRSPKASSTCGPTSTATACPSASTASERWRSAPGTASGPSSSSAAAPTSSRWTSTTSATSTGPRAGGRPPSPTSSAVGVRARQASCWAPKVERRVLSIYDATPEELGTFDLVFCGIGADPPARPGARAGAHRRAVQRPVHQRRGVRPVAGPLPMPAARYRADREQAVVFWLPNRRAWKRMIWGAASTTCASTAGSP